MKLRYNFVVQQVADDYVAVAVGEDASNFGRLVRMNKTGAFLFEMLKKDMTREELLAAMVEKYDADEEILQSNLDVFLEKLKEEKVLA